MNYQTMKEALKEVQEYSEDSEQLDEGLLSFMRTTAIAMNTQKSVASGKKVQQEARELRNIGNRLSSEKDPADAQKLIAEGYKSLSSLFLHQEEMIRRHTFLTASGSLFSDRAYNLLRKIGKKKR